MHIPKNEAVIKCFGQYIPVVDVQPVAGVPDMYKGTRVIEPGSPRDAASEIYFSRKNSNSEFERMWPEWEVNNTEILGEPFVLVPKEKVLFSYDPPSKLIFRPAPKLKDNLLGDL